MRIGEWIILSASGDDRPHAKLAQIIDMNDERYIVENDNGVFEASPHEVHPLGAA